MGLAAWFKKVQAEHYKAREITTCVNAALEAIAASDPDGVGRALAPIHGYGLPDHEAGSLLKAAIDQGDPETLAGLLALTEDPNAAIVEWHSGVRTAGYYSYTPPLNYALRVRNHDIALLLAKDSRTRIDDGAQNAFVMAKNSGMSDVAAVLAQRIAALRRGEAARWDETATRLSPALQP
jgi:hypothetical protein